MLVGFTCPENGERPGRNNKITYCIRKCRNPCAAPHVLSAMLEQEIINPHKGKLISVSMLTGGCTRKTLLERTIDYYVEPDNKLPTFRGSLVHAIIENADQKRLERAKWLIENHMELPCITQTGEWILSGTLDCYDPGTKTIYDIKTMQEYAVDKVVKGTEGGTWSKHISDGYVMQLNLYRYMFQRLGLGEVKRLRLQIFAFGRLILTGTTIKYGWGKNQKTYTIPDIPILDDTIIENLIQKKGDLWYRVLFKNEPAPVYDTGYEWLCRKCVFARTDYCPNPQLEKEQELKLQEQQLEKTD